MPKLNSGLNTAKKEVSNWETDLGNTLRIPKQDKKKI